MNRKKTCIVFIAVLIAPLLTGACCLAMPKAERIELPNHLKLLVFEEHSIPARYAGIAGIRRFVARSAGYEEVLPT